ARRGDPFGRVRARRGSPDPDGRRAATQRFPPLGVRLRGAVLHGSNVAGVHGFRPGSGGAGVSRPGTEVRRAAEGGGELRVACGVLGGTVIDRPGPSRRHEADLPWAVDNEFVGERARDDVPRALPGVASPWTSDPLLRVGCAVVRWSAPRPKPGGVRLCRHPSFRGLGGGARRAPSGVVGRGRRAPRLVLSAGGRSGGVPGAGVRWPAVVLRHRHAGHRSRVRGGRGGGVSQGGAGPAFRCLSLVHGRAGGAGARVPVRRGTGGTAVLFRRPGALSRDGAERSVRVCTRLHGYVRPGPPARGRDVPGGAGAPPPRFDLRRRGSPVPTGSALAAEREAGRPHSTGGARGVLQLVPVDAERDAGGDAPLGLVAVGAGLRGGGVRRGDRQRLVGRAGRVPRTRARGPDSEDCRFRAGLPRPYGCRASGDRRSGESAGPPRAHERRARGAAGGGGRAGTRPRAGGGVGRGGGGFLDVPSAEHFGPVLRSRFGICRGSASADPSIGTLVATNWPVRALYR